MADALSTKIDALISGAPNALSLAADSVANIQSGNDVLVSNFDHVEEVFDNLQAFLTELKSGAWYAPVGLISPFAGGSGSVPSGWLLCDGSAVSQATYSDLYTVIGSAYNTTAGNSPPGAGLFRVPDFRGRAPVGAGTGTGLTARSRGDSPGAEGLPEHLHSISAWATTDGAGAHSHSVSHTDQVYQGSGPGIWPAGNNGWNGYGAGNQGHSVSTNGAHNHTIPGTNTNNAGSGSHGVMQPSIVTNFIIKY